MNRVKSLFILNIIFFSTLIGPVKSLEIIRDTELENFTNDIIKILLTKRSKRNRSFQTNSNQTLIETYEANGSVYSIINWTRQTNLDAEQKRAFEIIIGSFVLTFYNEAKRDNNRSAHTRSLFVNEKSRLEQLVESQRMNSNQ